MTRQRILLVCPCLELGRDGVGDYVRQLATRLAGAGAEARVLAVNDRFVDEPTASEPARGVRFLRLPVHPWSAASLDAPARFIEEFDPHWVSLQVVAFSYGWRGIINRAGGWLSRLFRERHVHVMFHETWVGFSPDSSAYHRIWGALQRAGLRRMHARLKPKLTTTTNRRYQEILGENGLPAEVLPLMSNIPLVSSSKGSGHETAPRDFFRVVFFGGIHGGWSPGVFLGSLRSAADSRNLGLELVQLGSPNAFGEEAFRRFAADASSAGNLRVTILGHQDEEAIAHVLSTANLGGSTTPADIIGKSSAVATMVDHGLPVVLVRGSQAEIDRYAPEGMRPYLHAVDETFLRLVRNDQLARPNPGALDCPAERLLALMARSARS